MGGIQVTPYRPQSENLLDQVTKITALKNAQQESALRNQEVISATRQNEQTQAINSAYHDAITMDESGQPKIDSAKLSQSLAASGHGSAVPGILKSVQDYQKSAADLQEAKGKIQSQASEAMGFLGSAIQKANYDPNLADLMIEQHLRSPNASPQEISQLQQMRTQIQQNPQMLKTLADSYVAQSSQAAKNAEEFKNTQQGNEAVANTRKIQNETQFGPTGPAAEAKYRAILGQINAGQSVSDADLQFARGFELSGAKTTTQSDTLGVTSTNTSKPSGLAAASHARLNGGRSAVPQSGTSSAKDSIVDMVGQYKLNPTMLQRMVVKHPDVIAAVNQKYPDWDQTNYNAKNKMLLSYTSGPESKSINAINTALGHAGELGEAIKALDNGDVGLKTLRAIGNRLGVEVGGDAVTTFNTIVHRIAPEISAAYVQGGGTGAERGSDAKDFDASLGGSQLRNNLAETVKLLRSKIGAQENQWNTTFQPKKDSDQFQNRFITPAAKQTLNEWSAKAPTNAGKFQVGQSVSIRGKQMKVTAVHPDGSFDAQ